MTAFAATQCVWLILANVFFCASAFFKDILLVRLCLVLAYFNLLLQAVTGLAPFGQVVGTGPVAIDGFCWSVFLIIIHVSALRVLVIDELRPVKLEADFEAMYRCFYRRCGIHRLEFKVIQDNSSKVQSFKAGDVVADDDAHAENLFFLVEGIVETRSSSLGASSVTKAYSGHFLDTTPLNIFGVNLGSAFEARLESTALTHGKVLRIPVKRLHEMVNNSPPALGLALKNLVLFQLSMQGNAVSQGAFLDSSGDFEDGAFEFGAQSRDFAEYTEGELAQMKLKTSPTAYLRWIWRSLGPSVPHGLRHTMPTPLYSDYTKAQVLHRANEIKLFEAASAASAAAPGASDDDGLSSISCSVPNSLSNLELKGLEEFELAREREAGRTSIRPNLSSGSVNSNNSSSSYQAGRSVRVGSFAERRGSISLSVKSDLGSDKDSSATAAVEFIAPNGTPYSLSSKSRKIFTPASVYMENY